jgi:hypothetical protein
MVCIASDARRGSRSIQTNAAAAVGSSLQQLQHACKAAWVSKLLSVLLQV